MGQKQLTVIETETEMWVVALWKVCESKKRSSANKQFVFLLRSPALDSWSKTACSYFGPIVLLKILFINTSKKFQHHKHVFLCCDDEDDDDDDDDNDNYDGDDDDDNDNYDDDDDDDNDAVNDNGGDANLVIEVRCLPQTHRDAHPDPGRKLLAGRRRQG